MSASRPVITRHAISRYGIGPLVFLAAMSLFALASSAGSISESGGAKLNVSDSTDGAPAALSDQVTFFARLSNASSGLAVNGTCIISSSPLSISNQEMSFNGSGDSRFNSSVAGLPQGDTLFTVTCSSPGLGPVVGSDFATARSSANLSVQAPVAAVANSLIPVHFNVSYLNATSGSAISSASCVLRFQGEAGEPLNPLMVFNASTSRFETRRSFPRGGVVSFNATCTAGSFETLTSPQGSLLVRQLLPNVSSFQDAATTNFSSMDHLDAVSVTLANQFGRVRWVDPVNASSRDFDSFVRIGNNFASIDAGRLGAEYNSSIDVVLYNVYSNQVVKADGFFFFASDVRAAGVPCSSLTRPSCADIALVGSSISFRASFPVAFAMGGDANLSVSSTGPVVERTNLTFIASYFNASSGSPIRDGAPFKGDCLATISGPSGRILDAKMMFDGATYRFGRMMDSAGVGAFNVTCQSDVFTFQQATGSYQVLALPPGATPAASTPAAAPASPPPAEVPPGPVDPSAEASTKPQDPSPSRSLVATSGGVTTSFSAGEEVDLSINDVSIRTGISSIKDGVADARLGSSKGSLSMGQELLMDVDRDGKPDVSMKVLGIAKDSAKVLIKKLRGTDEGSPSPSDKAAGTGVKDASLSAKQKPRPIEEPQKGPSSDGLSWWWFVLIFLGLLGVGNLYFKYNQRMRHRFI